MTALLLKDLYTLAKQAKIFLLIIVVFAVIPGNTVSMMAVIYAAMLPMTALAYDERAKWDSLAAMMPYSAKEIVFSKYLLGYIAVIGACILSVAAQLISALVRNTGIEPKMPISVLSTACLAVILLAVNLPVMLRFGVEKGRIAFLVLFGVLGALTMGFSDNLNSLMITGTSTNLTGIALVALLLAVIVNFLSVLISTIWYKRKAL